MVIFLDLGFVCNLATGINLGLLSVLIYFEASETSSLSESLLSFFISFINYDSYYIYLLQT